jgi:hypothetical protein
MDCNGSMFPQIIIEVLLLPPNPSLNNIVSLP